MWSKTYAIVAKDKDKYVQKLINNQFTSSKSNQRYKRLSIEQQKSLQIASGKTSLQSFSKSPNKEALVLKIANEVPTQ